MTFTDTHCHIHESSYVESEAALARAADAGVKRLICVGTDAVSSEEAVQFAAGHEMVWASVGIHPHDAVTGSKQLEFLDRLLSTSKKSNVGKIVAIGECGLDYFYNNSPHKDQLHILEAQLQLASDYRLPVVFHVREAFDDFWPVYDNFSHLKAVLHSFTDSQYNLDQAIKRDLFIGVNGIATFAKADIQKKMYASIPVERLLFETDSPFLTPVPHRGMVNEPAFTTHVAQYIANLQAINLEELSRATERNATTLFFQTNN